MSLQKQVANDSKSSSPPLMDELNTLSFGEMCTSYTDSWVLTAISWLSNVPFIVAEISMLSRFQGLADGLLQEHPGWVSIATLTARTAAG